MAGYAKSVVFPSSSTLPELVVAAFGGERPEFAYKIYVLVVGRGGSLVGRAGVRVWRVPPREPRSPFCSTCSTSGPTSRSTTSTFGMLPYFVAVPLGLAATGRSRASWRAAELISWLLTAVLMSLAFCVHLTTAMVIAPAAALAYAGIAGASPGDPLDARSPAPNGPSAVLLAEPERRLTVVSHLAVW